MRLQSNSPCINAGYNGCAPSGSDLDGNPRIVGGRVDIGAYEFQSPTSLISYAWLQQYCLPTDGSVDTIDSDGDGMSNWQEWRAGTNPTNALSCLAMLAPSCSTNSPGVTVNWQSVQGINYYLQRKQQPRRAAAFQLHSKQYRGAGMHHDFHRYQRNWFRPLLLPGGCAMKTSRIADGQRMA